MAKPTIRQRLASLIGGQEYKATQTMQAILASGNINARWTPQTYAATAREGYTRNPYVYAAIHQIALALAGIKWDVYTDQSRDEELEEHPLKQLLERPNPRQGKSQFFENISAFLNMDGNAFIQCVGPDNKPPQELYVLRPDRVTVLPGTWTDPIAGYVYQIGNIKVPLPAETVRHLKTFNPLDDWRGLSPMAAAAMSVDQSNASKQWNVALLQNGARPPGAMSTEFNLDSDQYARIKEMIQEEYAGFMNAGRPLLLEGGLKWQEMGLSPQDMAWLEGQKLSAREIAIVYNIAPELLADSSNKTYSNYGEARVALYQENILPTCDWIRDELNAWLAPMYPDQPYIDYDRDDIEALQEDRDAIWTRADKAFTSGFIRLNEARELVGMDADEETEWGEKYIFELPQRAPAGGVSAGAPGVNAPAEGLPALPSGTSNPSGNGEVEAEGEAGGEGEVPPAASASKPAGGETAAKSVIPFARGRVKGRQPRPNWERLSQLSKRQGIGG